MPWYNYVFLANIIFIIYMGYRVYLLQSALNQSLLDNQIAIAMMATMKDELENSSKFKDDSNEDFIKFLSESRDWAFDYIENTITKINEVIEYCRKETNTAYIGDYRTAPILMNIVNQLLPLVEENKDKQ